jgi:hypothetical protein
MLTKSERRALEAVRDSEYQDGDPVGHEVWTSYVNPFSSRRTFSGVVSSLVKKGFLVTGGSTADANREAGCDGTTLALTAEGLAALKEAT